METYRVSPKTIQHYTTVFSQNGKGFDIDRYIYHQQGAGIGSFFGKLLRYVLPVAKTAISRTYDIAKPHIQEAGTQLVKGATRALTRKAEEVADSTINRINKKSKPDNLERR